MADDNKEELVAQIGVEVDKQKLDSSLSSLKKVGDGMLNIKSAAMKLLPVLAELFSAKQAENVTNFAATAEQLDMTTQQLRALQLASKNAGLDVGTVTGVIANLRQELLGYQTGNAPQALLQSLAKANSLLGTVLTPLTNTGKLKTAYQLFTDIAEAIGKIHDPEKQAAASVSILGSNLVPLIKNGTKGIQEAFQQLNSRGLFLNNGEIERMKEFNSQANLMKEELNSFGQRLSIALIPILAQFNKLLTNPENVKNFSNALMDLAKATVVLGKGLSYLVPLLDTVGKLIANGANVVGDVAGGVAGAFATAAIDAKHPKITLTPYAQSRLNNSQVQAALNNIAAMRNETTNNSATSNTSNKSSSNVVNNNVTHVNINGRKSMLSIPAYSRMVP